MSQFYYCLYGLRVPSVTICLLVSFFFFFFMAMQRLEKS